MIEGMWSETLTSNEPSKACDLNLNDPNDVVF
jgi:hypothetical protein